MAKTEAGPGMEITAVADSPPPIGDAQHDISLFNEMYRLPAGIVFALQTDRPELLGPFITQMRAEQATLDTELCVEIVRLIAGLMKDRTDARQEADLLGSRLDDLVARISDTQHEVDEALADAGSTRHRDAIAMRDLADAFT